MTCGSLLNSGGDSSSGRREAYYFGIREAGGVLCWHKGGGRRTKKCDKGGVFRSLQKLFNTILHTSSAILVHSRSFNFKIFFDHGECTNIQSKPFQGFHESEILKFSSTMVKVQTFKIHHSGALNKLQFKNSLQPW